MYCSLVNIIITSTCACKMSAPITCKSTNKYCSSCRITLRPPPNRTVSLLLSFMLCCQFRHVLANMSGHVALIDLPSQFTQHCGKGWHSALHLIQCMRLSLQPITAQLGALCHQHNPANLEAERSTYKYCKGIKITQINLSKHQVLS